MSFVNVLTAITSPKLKDSHVTTLAGLPGAGLSILWPLFLQFGAPIVISALSSLLDRYTPANYSDLLKKLLAQIASDLSVPVSTVASQAPTEVLAAMNADNEDTEVESVNA